MDALRDFHALAIRESHNLEDLFSGTEKLLEKGSKAGLQMGGLRRMAVLHFFELGHFILRLPEDFIVNFLCKVRIA